MILTDTIIKKALHKIKLYIMQLHGADISGANFQTDCSIWQKPNENGMTNAFKYTTALDNVLIFSIKLNCIADF